MNQPDLLLTPRRPALLSGFDNQLDVLVRLQAPAQPEGAHARSPLHLAIVIDRSGSMSGPPLEEAKRCARFMIDGLGPKDRASVVVYDNEVSTLIPSSEVVDKDRFHRAIRGVFSRGSTNLHGGWLKGAEQLSPHVRSDAISRVILLSDGLANTGLTDLGEITRQCAELARAGVTTSTYGLGEGFNEELMIQMARTGQGNPYYGRTAEDLMDPFQEEFDLLSALCAKEIRVSLSPSDGMTASVLNNYVQDGDGSYRLPGLAYEGEVWAVARVAVPESRAGNGDGTALTKVMTVSAGFQDIEGRSHEVKAESLELPSLSSPAWNAVAEDELVARRVAELEAARIQDEAYEAARCDDWEEVRRLLAEARENAKGNEWLGEVADKLQELAAVKDNVMFRKESRYSSAKMRLRLASVNESAKVPQRSYLRRKSEQGKAESKPGRG